MDSVPLPEFHGMFNRVADYIDLKGKYTVEEIEQELAKAREKCRKLRRKAETRRERTKFRMAAIGYSHLLEYGFAERVIQEARRNPKGIIAMTLKYGKQEAKRRILAQKRAEIRSKLRRRYWR